MIVALAVMLTTSTRLSEPVPAATLVPLHPLTATVAGATPKLTWPAVGQAAATVPATNRTWQSGPERPVPIASLTKMMTAYIVLRDHPIGPDEPGPTIVMTPFDQADVDVDTDQGGTTIPVRAGERLSERQLLDGLMVHSANNFADALAVWDAGSRAAFVARMNTTAATLGLTRTHYVDTNGLDPRSMSTAQDQVRLAARAMAIPTFAAVVNQPKVTLPMVGTLDNLVTDIGSNGIVGVKSGFLQAAMGCVVLAAERPVGNTHVLVLAAITGQPGFRPLETAQSAAVSLIDSVAAGLRHLTVASAGAPVATVDAPWHPGAPVTVSVTAPLAVLTWPGDVVRTSLSFDTVRSGLAAGAEVGSLVVDDGTQHVTAPLVTDAVVPRPSVRWRLMHG